MNGEHSIPAARNLFEVQDDAEDLTSEEKKIYCTFVGKILFLC